MHITSTRVTSTVTTAIYDTAKFIVDGVLLVVGGCFLATTIVVLAVLTFKLDILAMI